MALSKSNTPMKKRMLAVLFFVTFFTLVLVIKIGFLQFAQGDSLRKEAIEQQTRDRIISSKRGAILDRNGKQLAVSASVETVSVTPNIIKRAKQEQTVATTLAQILGKKPEDILAKINRNSYYEIIERKIEKPIADKIRQANMPGVNLDEDSKRYYPFGEFAGHILGFTGLDNQGLNGIEMVFDKNLKGKPGRVISAKNADGTEMPLKYEKLYSPEDGTNVVLTVDEVIQHYVEKHLETALIENKLQNGAAAIMMDVKTGEILAMATKPSFDLNTPFTIKNEEAVKGLATLQGDEYKKKFNEELQKMWRNKAVCDSYEPGSTFKIITSAMAIEEKVVNYTETFNCPGYLHVGNYNISCWKTTGHGVQTFLKGIQNSCNPVFMTLGARVGPQNFYKYFKGFGFREKTGLELPGETSGIFHDLSRFNEVELATSSFGQSFQITPLQLISAIGAVANDGKLLKPRLVKQLTDNSGNIVKTFNTEYVRQVISKETSSLLRQMLETVVSEGTGKNAYIKGFRVAGKTGTSEKLPRSSGKLIASFVGFAPADDPKVACLVILDEPAGAQTFGGVIAAPVVGNILDDTLRYLGVEPQFTKEEMETLDIVVPDLSGLDIEKAKKTLSDKKLKYKIEGNGNTVNNQTPKYLARLNQNSTVILYTADASPTDNVIVPDVIKKSAIEANTILINNKLNIKIIGATGSSAGLAVSIKQDPPPGTSVSPGSVVSVEFRHLEVD